MRLLAVAEKDIGVMDLARQLGVNAAAVTRQVKEMQREGLVQKKAVPLDNRRNTVTLSPQGRAAFEMMHERSHELERELAAVIGQEELAVTVTSLKRLRNFIKEQEEEDIL